MDSAVPRGGDGSPERPYRDLEEALSRAGEGEWLIHLASGLYPGPFQLPPGVSLRGAAAVVLYAEDPSQVVVRAGGKAELARLFIQGGRVGLVSTGSEVRLAEVKLSGFRTAGVRVEAGQLLARECQISGTVSGTVGVQVAQGARAVLEECSFEGGLGRAVEVRGGRLELRRSRILGPAVGLHQLAGEVEVSHSSFQGGRGPALFVAGGALRLKEVAMHGFEYGLQAGQGSQLWVSGFSSVRPERAAVALVGAQGQLEDLLALDTGDFPAVQLLESEVEFFRLRVHRAQGQGLFARGGRLRLSDALIHSVRAESGGPLPSGGDGVQLFGAQARLENLTVREAEGAGVLAQGGTSAVVLDFHCERCRWGGLVADASQLEVVGARVIGGEAAVAALGESRVRVDDLSCEQTGTAIWAECALGAEVKLGRLHCQGPSPLAACVQAR